MWSLASTFIWNPVNVHDEESHGVCVISLEMSNIPQQWQHANWQWSRSFIVCFKGVSSPPTLCFTSECVCHVSGLMEVHSFQQPPGIQPVEKVAKFCWRCSREQRWLTDGQFQASWKLIMNPIWDVWYRRSAVPPHDVAFTGINEMLVSAAVTMLTLWPFYIRSGLRDGLHSHWPVWSLEKWLKGEREEKKEIKPLTELHVLKRPLL